MHYSSIQLAQVGQGLMDYLLINGIVGHEIDLFCSPIIRAGAIFGVVENILVTLLTGLHNGSMRALWSVPFHAGTALIIGLYLAQPAQTYSGRW